MRRYWAIEYAYGPNVVNNGPRADKVVAFTSPHIRAVWINRGNELQESGYRDTLSAVQGRKALQAAMQAGAPSHILDYRYGE